MSATIAPTATQNPTTPSSRPPLNPLPSSQMAHRFRVMANGHGVAGVVNLTLEMNSFMAADVFSATIATYADEERGMAWWCDQDEVEIEVQQKLFVPQDVARAAGVPPLEWTTLFVGEVDDMKPDFVRGLVNIRGRDLTARLIESGLQESYPNVRASELAKRFAAEHGLQADVVDSPGLAGANYQNNRNTGMLSTFSRASNQWDLLVHHAMREGYDVWVQGKTLHYKPMVEPDPAEAWEIHFAGPRAIAEGMVGNAAASTVFLNAHSLDVVRHLNLAKDIEVTVQSRDAATGQNIVATVRGDRARTEAPRRRRGGRRRRAALDPNDPLSAVEEGGDDPNDPLSAVEGGPGGGGGGGGGGDETPAPSRANAKIKRYTFNIPGITSQDEAIRIAQARLEDISKFEREISFEIRTPSICTPRDMVRLVGTQSSFDQHYYVHENELSYTDEGLVQTIKAKNTSPRDEVKNSVQGDEGGSQVQARSRAQEDEDEEDDEAPPPRPGVRGTAPDESALLQIENRPPPANTRPDQ